MLKIYHSDLDGLSATNFLPFSILLWVLTHTLGTTTGVDQLANRYVKLWRQEGLFLDLLQSRGNNRLWLCFRKCTTVFTFCVD